MGLTLGLMALAGVTAAVVCACSRRHVGLSVGAAIAAALVQMMITIWAFPTMGLFYSGLWITLFQAAGWGALFGVIRVEKIPHLQVGFPLGLLGVWFLVWFVSSCAAFNAADYRNNIGEVQVGVFTEDAPIINTKHARQVPIETALKAANKVLGQAKEGTVLGSQLAIDTKSAAIQEVQGELWWIFPLDFDGFWKWKNRKTVPGYIRVSAQDPTREAQFMDTDPETGKDFKLKYTRKAYWGSWLNRIVYFKYPTIGREEFTYEVNDNWRPHYVVSATYPTIGFGGRQTKGVIIVDPQTGEMNLFEEGEIPDWVDRVKPLNQALKQTKYWGRYVNGWWNTGFGKKDIQVPTTYQGGQDMWFVKIGEKKYWFTGMTSATSADQSLVGMTFVDTRSTKGGGAIYYSAHGSDESGVVEAVDSSLGADAARWHPAQPIPYNIYGTATWVLPVISSEGIFQKIALVDVGNINIRASDETLERALARYRRVLAQKGNEVAPTSFVSLKRLGPVAVSRVGDTVLSGDKTYLIMVEGHSDKLFSSTGEVQETRLAALVREGDIVILDFLETDEPLVPIEGIQIEGIELKVSPVQTAFDVQREASQRSEDEVSQTKDAEKIWESLTPEEKRKVLEELRQQEAK